MAHEFPNTDPAYESVESPLVATIAKLLTDVPPDETLFQAKVLLRQYEDVRRRGEKSSIVPALTDEYLIGLVNGNEGNSTETSKSLLDLLDLVEFVVDAERRARIASSITEGIKSGVGPSHFVEAIEEPKDFMDLMLGRKK